MRLFLIYNHSKLLFMLMVFKNTLLLLYTNNKKTIIMTTSKLTIREIRAILFKTEKYTVIGSEEMTNKESRDYLYSKQNQDECLNVIDNDSHLLIW